MTFATVSRVYARPLCINHDFRVETADACREASSRILAALPKSLKEGIVVWETNGKFTMCLPVATYERLTGVPRPRVGGGDLKGAGKHLKDALSSLETLVGDNFFVGSLVGRGDTFEGELRTARAAHKAVSMALACLPAKSDIPREDAPQRSR